MRSKFYVLISLFALVFSSAVFIDAQTTAQPKKGCATENNSDSNLNAKATEVRTQIDLSVPAALFIVGAKRTAIDFETDKCLSDGETKWISGSGIVSATCNLYRYNIGFVVFFVLRLLEKQLWSAATCRRFDWSEFILSNLIR